jgi:hypothetical protein
MLTGNDLLNAVKELRSNENSKSVTITKEQLNQLWNAIEYTRGTIGNGCVIESTEKPDWVLIHKGRAHQSREFLNQAKDLVNQLKKELQ